MSAELPVAARRAMWTLRAGLGVAAAGIVGFFLSYGQVGAPSLAAADYHPMPPLALLSIGAWVAGMTVALAAGWHARGLARKYASERAVSQGDGEDAG